MVESDPRSEQSLLTSLQREYLHQGIGTGNKDRVYRHRIRNRAERGLNDLALCNQKLRNSDIEAIFLRDRDNATGGNQELPDGRKVEHRTNWVLAMHMVAFAWQGLRSNGMDKGEIFKKVIRDGIVWGEAEYKGVDMGAIEHDIALNTLKVHNKDELDPLEKLERGLAMSGDDYQELQDRLNNHPDVDKIIDKDIRELSKKYLLDSDSQTDN